tara:strand:+ start:4 stop:132 length:129 start_codon:yes stop_codon:yes gene_type:complete
VAEELARVVETLQVNLFVEQQEEEELLLLTQDQQEYLQQVAE